MASSRLRTWLREARTGLGPWDATPEATLATLGGRCGSDEIAEAIAMLDDLSREKAELPDWDGDSADDVSAAQATYMRILGQVDPALVPVIAKGFQSSEPDTRRWVTLALAMHGALALPFLREAAERETDTTTRAFMTEAIGRIEAA